MINLQTANNALKTVYLDVLDNLLNVSTNPLFAKIKKTTQGVSGKEIKVLAPYGINGGISATSETGELPQVAHNSYVNFVTDLKNLYGRIEISDKAVRASQNSAGAFVNLLNDEMEGLIKSSAFNLSRMLYGDGRGLLSEVVGQSNDKKTLTVGDVTKFIEGMVCDIVDGATWEVAPGGEKHEIIGVDRANKTVTFASAIDVEELSGGGYHLVNQNSYGNEITGIDAFFNGDIRSVYGLAKNDYPFVKGLAKNNTGALNEITILENIDTVEENTGVKINFISCSSAVRRQYQNLLISGNRNIQTIDLGNGFKGLDFYGIPMVSDRFVRENEMYLMDTDSFTLHQLCDWEWMTDDSGNVLSQKSGYPVYTATLVKYADLICNHPSSKFKSLMFRPFKKCRKIRGFSDFRFPKNCKIDISLCKF